MLYIFIKINKNLNFYYSDIKKLTIINLPLENIIKTSKSQIKCENKFIKELVLYFLNISKTNIFSA